MMLCNSLRDRLRPWLRDYDRLQSFAVILIYIQVHSCPHRDCHSLLFPFCIVNLIIILNTHEIDRVRIDWIPRGVVQRCFAYKFGDRIVRFGSHREQQSESWSYICCSPVFCDFPRHLLVYSFRLRHMVSPSLSF